MMTYDDLIKTVLEIIKNDDINKEGISLVYYLENHNHLKLNECFFYKSNPITTKFKPSDKFEVEVGGILITFLKKTHN